jgi:MFS superfamily sulfate permease-like transporter
MLSKEKIEDDYIKLIRLQSYQTGIVVLLLIALIIFLFDITFEISLGMAISIFMMLFLVIFYFKKRIDQ